MDRNQLLLSHISLGLREVQDLVWITILFCFQPILAIKIVSPCCCLEYGNFLREAINESKFSQPYHPCRDTCPLVGSMKRELSSCFRLSWRGNHQASSLVAHWASPGIWGRSFPGPVIHQSFKNMNLSITRSQLQPITGPQTLTYWVTIKIYCLVLYSQTSELKWRTIWQIKKVLFQSGIGLGEGWQAAKGKYSR